MTQLVSPPPDAVSDTLRTFGIRSTVFCLSELRAPWAFSVSDEPVAKFHLVLDGSAVLSCTGEAIALAEGDLVVLPRGVGHTISAGAGSPALPLERLIAEHGLDDGTRLRYGGSGPLTRLLCGGFALAEGIPDSTLALLPDTLHIPLRGGAPWLATMLTELRLEAEVDRPGASAILAKIADVFLAQALRVWLLEVAGDGLADPRRILDEPIAKAVQALNDDPSEPWSIERLARHVSLSRTALATKFRQGVGETPMRYLSEVRMRRAAGEMVSGRLTLRQVARRAGYETDAAFAKAFKRRFGLSPGAYRDDARKPPRVEVTAIR